MAVHTQAYYRRGRGPVKRSLPPVVSVSRVQLQAVYLQPWKLEFWWRHGIVKSRSILGSLEDAQAYLSRHGSLVSSGPGCYEYKLHSPIEVSPNV